MKKIFLITICFFLALFPLFSQDEDTVAKGKYKFVFIFDDMECSNCYVSCVKGNVDNIQNQFKDIEANLESQFKDTAECYIIIQVREIGDAAMYRKLIKNATIIETTEKLDFSRCGITKFPGLICYNEYNIPIKVYNDIAQKAPILHSKMFDILCKNINEFKHVPLIENDSASYVSLASTSVVYDDKLYCIDDLTFKLHKINANTGELESSFNLNNPTIGSALLEDKYRTSEYSKGLRVGKIYGSSYTHDSIFVAASSTKEISTETKYLEEYDDTVETRKHIHGILLVSMDRNYNYTFYGFSSDMWHDTAHGFAWFFYIKNNCLLFPVIPYDKSAKNIGNLTYLLTKLDLNKVEDSVDYKLIYPYTLTRQTTTADHYLTSKIIDNNDNIFLVNTAFDVFAKVDNKNNNTDYRLQGAYGADMGYTYKDSTINTTINKNETVYSMFLDELNDSLLVTGLIYNSYISADRYLCVQTYTKEGKFVKEKTYHLENVSNFNYSCIYENNLVFLYKKDNIYNLVYIPIV